MISNKNTHTFERSLVEIDKIDNIQDIIIDKLSLLTLKSLEEQKQVSYRGL